MRRLRFLLLTFALSLAFASASGAQTLMFRTENDIFSTQPARDDLHTFATALEIEGGATLYALREEAFTDREAGVRFDETQLSFGRALPRFGAWGTYGEAGIVRVGEGLFGQETQNEIHRALGSETVELPYLDPSLHARLALAVERSFRSGRAFTVGPRVELEWVSNLRAHAVVAAQALLDPLPNLELHLLAGGRWSDASLEALARHTKPFDAVVRIGVTAFERIVLAWSYNDHGDGRTHLSVGYRFNRWTAGGVGSGARR
jgi:hypothetical protein